MKEHLEFQAALDAYVASRLEEEPRLRLEAHLKECEPCREMVSFLAEFARTLAEGGETTFEAHPAHFTLRSFALGETRHREPKTARHVEECVSCALEVGAWKRTGLAHSDTAGSGSASRAWKPALWLAAGVVLGLVLAVFARVTLPIPEQIGLGLESTAPTAGPVLVLPQGLRGARESVVYAPDRQAVFVVVACPGEIPSEAAPGETFVYVIRAADGRVVWSQVLKAVSIREHLASPAASVTLLVPVASLGPGHYEFTLSGSSAQAQPLYRVGLDIPAGG